MDNKVRYIKNMSTYRKLSDDIKQLVGINLKFQRMKRGYTSSFVVICDSDKPEEQTFGYYESKSVVSEFCSVLGCHIDKVLGYGDSISIDFDSKYHCIRFNNSVFLFSVEKNSMKKTFDYIRKLVEDNKESETLLDIETSRFNELEERETLLLYLKHLDIKFNEPIQYPLYIERPKKMDLTVAKFNKLSYIGLGSFWCVWKVVFHYDLEGNMKVYTHNESLFEKCVHNYRFKGIKFFEISSVEMYTCTIPKGNKLIATIEKNFSHLIMK